MVAVLDKEWTRLELPRKFEVDADVLEIGLPEHLRTGRKGVSREEWLQREEVGGKYSPVSTGTPDSVVGEQQGGKYSPVSTKTPDSVVGEQQPAFG